jgi:hypothetical protein
MTTGRINQVAITEASDRWSGLSTERQSAQSHDTGLKHLNVALAPSAILDRTRDSSPDLQHSPATLPQSQSSDRVEFELEVSSQRSSSRSVFNELESSAYRWRSGTTVR